jgi:hypothetical protein
LIRRHWRRFGGHDGSIAFHQTTQGGGKTIGTKTWRKRLVHRSGARA